MPSLKRSRLRTIIGEGRGKPCPGISFARSPWGRRLPSAWLWLSLYPPTLGVSHIRQDLLGAYPKVQESPGTELRIFLQWVVNIINIMIRVLGIGPGLRRRGSPPTDRSLYLCPIPTNHLSIRTILLPRAATRHTRRNKSFRGRYGELATGAHERVEIAVQARKLDLTIAPIFCVATFFDAKLILPPYCPPSTDEQG